MLVGLINADFELIYTNDANNSLQIANIAGATVNFYYFDLQSIKSL